MTILTLGGMFSPAGGAAAGAKTLKNVTKEIIERKASGRDGGISRHIIEKVDGKTNSVTHQVERNDEIIHQHQTHVGEYGSERQFPNEWIEYPDIYE